MLWRAIEADLFQMIFKLIILEARALERVASLIIVPSCPLRWLAYPSQVQPKFTLGTLRESRILTYREGSATTFPTSIAAPVVASR